MSLALLAPAALGLLALVLGPVLAHLTRQHIRDRRPFGAMLLLERLQRRLQRQRRLSDLLLLFFRALAVALCALAAARPEARWPESAEAIGRTGRVIAVLDTSMSMDQRVGGEPAFALARKDLAESVRALPPGTEVGLIVAGTTAEALTPALVADPPLVAAQIEAVEPGFGGTDLSGALTLARGLLQGRPGEVVVATDESGPGVVEACAHDLERLLAVGASVIPRVHAPEEPRNVAIAEAEYGDGIEGGTVRVRVVNYGDGAREVPTTVLLPDGTRLTSFVSVPGAAEAGPGVQDTRFTVPRQAAGGVARVEVDDPDLPADNLRWFHLPQVGASRVLVVDGDPGSTPTRSEVYFLERALAPFGAGGAVVDVVAPAGFSALDPERHRVAWLANVADPGPLAPTLVDFVRRGGGVVLAMGENVTAERYNVALASLLPSPLRRARDLVDLDAAEGTPLSAPLEDDGLFRPFLRLGPAPWEAIRSRRVMTLEPYAESDEVRTLLRYRDGVPALVERRIGTGRVLVWTGTMDLGWGNLPLQSLYAPLVQRLTGWLGGETGSVAATATGVVDLPVELPVPVGATGVGVVGPDDRLVAAERGPRSLTFVGALPGAYAARVGEDPPLAWAAVNPPLAESDVRRGASLVATQAKLDPERQMARLPLSTGLAGAALGCLLVAGVLGRGRIES